MLPLSFEHGVKHFFMLKTFADISMLPSHTFAENRSFIFVDELQVASMNSVKTCSVLKTNEEMHFFYSVDASPKIYIFCRTWSIQSINTIHNVYTTSNPLNQ